MRQIISSDSSYIDAGESRVIDKNTAYKLNYSFVLIQDLTNRAGVVPGLFLSDSCYLDAKLRVFRISEETETTYTIQPINVLNCIELFNDNFEVNTYGFIVGRIKSMELYNELKEFFGREFIIHKPKLKR